MRSLVSGPHHYGPRREERRGEEALRSRAGKSSARVPVAEQSQALNHYHQSAATPGAGSDQQGTNNNLVTNILRLEHFRILQRDHYSVEHTEVMLSLQTANDDGIQTNLSK